MIGKALSSLKYFDKWLVNKAVVALDATKTLYVAGHIVAEHPDCSAWDLLGVFSNSGKAESACYDESCFVGPVLLDKPYPERFVEWEGAYFPNLQQEKRP